MQPLAISPQGSVEMTRVAAPPKLDLSPKNSQVLSAKKVLPLSTQENVPKMQKKSNVAPPSAFDTKSMVVDIDASIEAEEIPQEVLQNDTAQEHSEIMEDNGLSLIGELGLHEDTDLGAMMEPPENNAGQDTYEL